ncbi:MAG: metallophosphoesterase [Alphaproteobacteria bacterium]|nr:metallophosphoesterase [Alphaproteobacteria bacterium]MCD8520081.1 metallophosphoesterase [Alphaproteobacteria bacterium]MCD8526549.1 metallophosphoesterase [Alphaproteobacteria bacterium]MCD8571338.1 metallophosphoesterase [Alphaproteobacteria bacterium]
MQERRPTKFLVISDIHYGIDYKSRNDSEDKHVMGGWGRTVMPTIVTHSRNFDAVLDIGDSHTAYDWIFEKGQMHRWVWELENFRVQMGLHKYFNVFGNHCGKISDRIGYPFRPGSDDFCSQYVDLPEFRIVLSNAGTRQMSSVGRFIPTEHFRWLEDVIGNSPKPVIFVQHVPPDEFDNGDELYEFLSGLEMVALAIHGHRHDPTKMEVQHGIPVLHMQALLKEGHAGIPDINIAEITATDEEIQILARGLNADCGTDKLFRIDRRDLNLTGAAPAPCCPHSEPSTP